MTTLHTSQNDGRPRKDIIFQQLRLNPEKNTSAIHGLHGQHPGCNLQKSARSPKHGRQWCFPACTAA